MDETQAIGSDENSDTLVFFSSCVLSDKGKEFTVLGRDVADLSRLSDTFQAPNAAFYIPCMAVITTQQWSSEEILVTFHYSTVLKIKYLRKLAAQQFISLGPIEEWNIDTLPSNQASNG